MNIIFEFEKGDTSSLYLYNRINIIYYGDASSLFLISQYLNIEIVTIKIGEL